MECQWPARGFGVICYLFSQPPVRVKSSFFSWRWFKRNLLFSKALKTSFTVCNLNCPFHRNFLSGLYWPFMEKGTWILCVDTFQLGLVSSCHSPAAALPPHFSHFSPLSPRAWLFLPFGVVVCRGGRLQKGKLSWKRSPFSRWCCCFFSQQTRYGFCPALFSGIGLWTPMRVYFSLCLDLML